MNKRQLARLAGAAGVVGALALAPLSAPAALAQPAAPPAAEQHLRIAAPGDGTARGAVEWYRARAGDTSYEGLCEKAAENAWGVTGVWPSAIDHWNGAVAAGKAHTDGSTPPEGAFVYWNISQYGHVGIADGNGGFYSTSVNGAIGHAASTSHFANYLGWSDPQVPAGG
ncbi:CHAP domain-containing protein [Saccharopolyspora griseoalba]|uniref:CHAP domain-containing protein n=1 Tax=Saccharopolyspora griseoalba TaxID=1431848 RepID=A0ABW2LDV2_9PSEU